MRNSKASIEKFLFVIGIGAFLFLMFYLSQYMVQRKSFYQSANTAVSFAAEKFTKMMSTKHINRVHKNGMHNGLYATKIIIDGCPLGCTQYTNDDFNNDLAELLCYDSAEYLRAAQLFIYNFDKSFCSSSSKIGTPECPVDFDTVFNGKYKFKVLENYRLLEDLVKEECWDFNLRADFYFNKYHPEHPKNDDKPIPHGICNEVSSDLKTVPNEALFCTILKANLIEASSYMNDSNREKREINVAQAGIAYACGTNSNEICQMLVN